MREVAFTEDKTYFGMNKNELFYLINANTIRASEGGEPHFEPNSDGQFDYMLYITLLMISNAEREFCTTINILAKKMGYKPKSGTGKINDKILKSLDRLMTTRRMIEYGEEDKVFYGKVILYKNESKDNEILFKLKRHDVNKILDNPFLKLSKDDYTDKYGDKSKALYVYSYLISMMKTHNTTESTIEWCGCFPNIEKICEDCNVSASYLLKLLAFFEIDGLIYTTNIGKVKSPEGNSRMACNYYTNDLRYLSSSYIYARAYYDLHNFTYGKHTKQTKAILGEITELLEKSFEKLNDKEVKCFKEHYGLMFNNTLHEFSEMYPGINRNEFDKYMKNSFYLNSHFFDNRHRTSLYFIADNELAAIPLLTHIKNKIKAMMYLYEIKTT